MGRPDNSLLDLIGKVTSWISGRSCKSKMGDNSFNLCCQMDLRQSSLRYHCQGCGRLLCDNCVGGYGSFGDSNGREEAVIDIMSCKFCSDFSIRTKGGKYSDKIHPSESPRQSPEPPRATTSICERVDGCFLHALSSSNPSPLSVHAPRRSDEEEGEDSAKHLFSSYSHDTSDIDSSSVSTRHEFYSYKSDGSSPSDSPSRIHITSDKVGLSVQQEQGGIPTSHHVGPFDHENMAVLKRPDKGTTDVENTNDKSIFRDQCEQLRKPLDFENNGRIWFPPPPKDEDDEGENNFFAYDDEDDEIGESSTMFSSSNSLASVFPEKEKQNENHKEPLRAVVQGHFRALVLQLLQGECIRVGKENGTQDWLDIVTTIAWQAANFVKPYTSKGGSMDPSGYVKVKCIASGNPSESKLVKGVVCTKNIKHKRMSSQYKNPRLLVLGGSLEYQRVPNQLASLNTLLQQEIDHLKMIVSKIEVHRPNVLLVEKSVSSYAQEYLLEKEISLVSNVKRPLLERIARCTGAPITPSTERISTTRSGHCELFRLERVSEEHEAASQFNKKPSKTLMFFEGCPRRLGCTVLLKGSCRDELKKVKHVIQYAIFAAYHLSLETSFLADEGASLPKMVVLPYIATPEKTIVDSAITVIPTSVVPTTDGEVADLLNSNEGPAGLTLERGEQELLVKHYKPYHNSSLTPIECSSRNVFSDAFDGDLKPVVGSPEIRNQTQEESLGTLGDEETQSGELAESTKFKKIDEASSEYYSVAESHQSILVSFSSRCVLNGTVCERSRLLRIKFYDCCDKPLGKYLRDDLFDQTSCCRSCQEPAEAHVICYTHQQGNLTINCRRLPTVKLQGERDGKIWMWHRCLKCPYVDGVPPATCRVVMSDAAWGLSFGKFLELSFSNHATGNRVASCGHSLQRDCLRYYGFGSMVAFFRYSPIDILSVRLPPSVLEFNGHFQQDWLRKEAAELLSKTEALYEEILGVLSSIEQKGTSSGHESSDTNELRDHIVKFKELLAKERNDYNDLLQPSVDIIELNHLRHTLLLGSHVWDHRLYSLDSLLKPSSSSKAWQDSAIDSNLKDWRSDLNLKDSSLDHTHKDNVSDFSKLQRFSSEGTQLEQKGDANRSVFEPGVHEDSMSTSFMHDKEEEIQSDGEIVINNRLLESAASNLSEKIDSAWTGTDGPEASSPRQLNQVDNPPIRRLMSPTRVYSFDSALRLQERIRKGLPPSSLHLSTLRSFHASGDYRDMVRDPVSNVRRTYSQILPREVQKKNLLPSTTPSFFSSASLLPEGARLLFQQNGENIVVITVYDNEPTSIISYALSSKEFEDWVASHGINKQNSVASNFSSWHSFGSLDLDYTHYGVYGSEDASMTIGGLFNDPKSSPHLTISFEDESSNAKEKVMFSVTCYFAKQFDALRKKCCPSKVDFVRSLSRCKRWNAQGGKSNVYFAKSLDERFIIKQVTKTELEAFEEFAPEYFKYLTDSLNSGSPTCLAKILGIYQVVVKHLKGGKETKMDLMVMENLFFKRSISRVYDLKGSSRSRYNSDTTGTNKVLLDMNLLEALRTKPIFLGSKAKRSLERAVWNDTSFLASVDVMDYSLLVGVDDEGKELVLGIIDFMRQYTWDKHLETWVKESGILGGPKNVSPTIVSPKQYKRRFRKAMTTYFLTVPDQWSS